MTLDLESQPILRDRIERYAAKRKLPLGDAIERLVRLGLFTEAAPPGSVLIRNGNGSAWEAPRPPSRQPEPDDGGDIPF